jgi:5-methyltetrahydropteroyltriglutamate--homocysteine methyltransferase
MHRSTDRILTTHVGSLPRDALVTDLLFAEERDLPLDRSRWNAMIGEAVRVVVARQVECGIDIVSDGEMSKISYATYIRHRLSGFSGDSPGILPGDLEAHPGYQKMLAGKRGTAAYRRPCCTGPVRFQDRAPLDADIANLRAAMSGAGAAMAFMNSASPGVISLFQPDRHYGNHDAYLEAVAEAMRPEYEAIHAAGLVLQVDSPDLALGRHTLFKDRDEASFLMAAERHVEVLNHALRNVPAEAIRVHVCWGNYEGPHDLDVPLDRLLPVLLRLRAGALSFEGANPRHAHEWSAFVGAALPEQMVLIPGTLDSTSNYVEHPDLVAERLCRYADIVGRERVLAGTDCGFGTFAGMGSVHPDIVWAKLRSLAEGAGRASRRLWGRG